MWQIEFHAPFSDLHPLVAAFDEDRIASIFWKEEKPLETWKVTVVFASNPDLDYWKSYLNRYCMTLGVSLPPLQLSEVPETDWLRENQKMFAPFRVGSFYIHGSRHKKNIPPGSYPLMIDAATAFGSGQHETTQGCLLVMEELKKDQKFTPVSVLDVGCGSGILAMGAARLWHTSVVAIDIDPEAVEVAEQNVRHNHLDALVRVEIGEGEALPVGAYDLIVANILADPLCQMAPSLRKVAHSGSYVILSGLLNEQAEYVVRAYEAQGWHLQEQRKIKEWSTLLLVL